MKKRVLFTFVVITLCFMFIGKVKAEDVSSAEQFNTAIANPSTEIVKLTDDIEITSTNVDFIINGANRTLDLNGKTLTINGTFRPYYDSGNTLIITDTKVGGKLVSTNRVSPFYNMYSEDKVYLQIDGGIFEFTSDYVFTNTHYFYLTINKGTFKSNRSLFHFYSTYAGDITLNNLIFEALDKNNNTNIYLSRDKYEDIDVSTKLCTNCRLLYTKSNYYSINTNKTFGQDYDAKGTIYIGLYKIVTFNSNGGSPVDFMVVNNGDKLNKFDNPTKDGYKLGGWYEDSSFTNKFDLNSEITYDMDLHAKWLGDLSNMSYTKIPTTVSKIYNGKKQKQNITVTFDDKLLEENTDYTVDYEKNINAGTAYVIIKGTGEYAGERKKSFQILQANNPMIVTTKTKKLKYKKVKKKAQTISLITLKNAQGNISYSKVSGSKKITINKRNGKITVKKKTKKGTYKIKVKVTAQGSNNYKSISKTVTLQIKIK